ncbi:anthranilate synthase component I [Tunturibacter empetritectus]|uniref:Anthranilate synthase component 1 n=1 Tax=Tunturiibacter lichenicola TaxID=2051959 RepID=A0A7W8JCZ6_9BACT|nr:anthranilate synthase component I [Edaphobacter lichenicola]MBB5345672.1 anthranilate synthase component 1 [Edaphobacter lichenicola]
MPSFDSNSLPSAAEFLKLSRKHSLVPVYRTVTADLETPVSAFLRIASEEPEAFLLESVEGGEHVGRYTFIGIQPYKRMVARGTRITVREGRRESAFDGDIFEELKKALSGHTPARLPGLPPFTAGAVGFFAYDVVRQIEKLPSLAKDELGVPDACLMFFDQVLAFDHVKKEIHLMVTADLTREAREGAYERAVRRLNKMEKRLAEALPVRKKKKPEGRLKITSRTPKAAFLKAVEKTKEYIASGDVFQCVISQRFDCVPGVDAFEVYRALRIVNPSPYMYFLRFGLEDAGEAGLKPSSAKARRGAPASVPPRSSVAHIVGSSPELLVRVHGREVEYRPIAGTRPRGADEAKDRAMEADLRADEKEVAEHIMLVDLGRNDVGRVSEFGSVKVKDLMFVERYSHVMHMVSSLEGKLKAGLGALDAFRACFPAGTLSGAPKIRAMEIIEELEPARRGVYGGSVLYADFSGNLDSCIAIRTLFMNGGQGHFQAGGGIVADSVPEKEFEESVNKARAVVRAIERARGV